MHQPLGRCASRRPASLVVGVLLVCVFDLDLRFVATSGRGRALVGSVTGGGRSGITLAEVERLDGAGPRRANLRAWHTALQVGELVAIRNRGTGAGAVVLDRNWDLFWRSGAALIAASVAFVLEAAAAPTRRHQRHPRSTEAALTP